MSDYIKRSEAVEAVCGHCKNKKICDDYLEERCPYRVKLEALPSAEVEPREHGEWNLCKDELPSVSGTYLTTTAKGSVCTDHFYATEGGEAHWSFHRRREPIAWMPMPKPYCGAKMDKESDGE